ncbi:tetratricopeptide repeat protein [Halorhodospira halochloris]|uniref:tetratricopeptide repeat protein n=1 Tax=Halorhodospira halochloris TaxID=1052 RepID=UPI001EE79111|nr:tetratricopeptide repeat protein [Halorhodospira halochloris]MCG5548043.1 tetratricopeptide repeat protein [Halorhodospira halochloris]
MIRGLGAVVIVSGLIHIAGCYVPPEEGGAPQAQDSRQPQAAGRDSQQDDGSDDRSGWLQQDQQSADDRRQQGQSPGWGREQGVSGLSRQAREAYEAGNYHSAAESLESALEQEPDHPVLLQKLAAVRYQLGDFQRSENLAQRAISRGGNNNDVLRESWWLIAASRMQVGDTQGAQQAAQTASRYESGGQMPSPPGGGQQQPAGPGQGGGMGAPGPAQQAPFGGQQQPPSPQMTPGGF